MSLFELQISLFLSSILCVLVLNQYSQLTTQNRQLTTIQNQQLQQMLLTQILTQSIQQAGFLPCGSQRSFDIWDARNETWLHLNALTLSADKVQTFYIDHHFAKLQTDSSMPTITLQTRPLQNNQPVLLTNCEFSELNYIKSTRLRHNRQIIRLMYSSRFKIDSDSYIGRWHQDTVTFQDHQLYFGGKRKEQIASNIDRFQLTTRKQKLVDITWQFHKQPLQIVSIWPKNQSLVNASYERPSFSRLSSNAYKKIPT